MKKVRFVIQITLPKREEIYNVVSLIFSPILGQLPKKKLQSRICLQAAFHSSACIRILKACLHPSFVNVKDKAMLQEH